MNNVWSIEGILKELGMVRLDGDLVRFGLSVEEWNWENMEVNEN